jgi:GntR family transcriptional regulator
MIFKVDLASSTSVYLQVCEQVKYAVATGALAPGDRLPTIREVAAETRVNRNTIARAYSELERAGIIASRSGKGSFVAPSATAIQKRERLRILEEMIRKLLVEAYHFQISSADLHKLFQRVETRFQAGEEKP